MYDINISFKTKISNMHIIHYSLINYETLRIHVLLVLQYCRLTMSFAYASQIEAVMLLLKNINLFHSCFFCLFVVSILIN